MTTVVTTFSDRRRVKRWQFERKVLRKLSIEQLKMDVEVKFRSVVPFYFLTHPFLLDPCMDMAIDAYLVGAESGRFGYFGEKEDKVLERCDDELTEITYCIFNLLQGWLIEADHLLDSLHIKTKEFVVSWWRIGFVEGKKQHKLRLH